MQEQILDKNPSTSIRVYAVWLPMLPYDSRAEWDSQFMQDARVTHLWDEQRVSGRWFAQLQGRRGVSWDAYYLFAPNATWGTTPPQILSAGSSIIETRDRLRRSVEPLLHS